MARELKHYITLRETPVSAPSSFGPGQKLPSWVLERIEGKEHLFVESAGDKDVLSRQPAVQFPSGIAPETKDEPTPKLTEPAATDLGKPEVETPEEDDVPRRNASRVAWAKFAGSFEPPIPVTEQMSRDDIIKACEDAEVIEAD